MLQGLSFLLALACATAMGLAIQRGATCTVAAVDDLLRTGRPAKGPASRRSQIARARLLAVWRWWRSTRMRQVSSRFFALVRYRPMVLM